MTDPVQVSTFTFKFGHFVGLGAARLVGNVCIKQVHMECIRAMRKAIGVHLILLLSPPPNLLLTEAAAIFQEEASGASSSLWYF